MPAGGIGKRLGLEQEPGACKRQIDFLPTCGCGESRLPPVHTAQKPGFNATVPPGEDARGDGGEDP